MTPEFASKICVEVDRLGHFARVTRRKIVKQQKFNSAVVLYTMAATASVVVLTSALCECKKRIAALEQKMRGEPTQNDISEETNKEG